MDDQVEVIKSNKGGLKVIHKGYMYTVHKKRQCGGIRWRCAQRSLHCKGSISTGVDGPPKVNMPHNHLPDLHSVALARGRQIDDFGPVTQFLDVKFEEDPGCFLLKTAENRKKMARRRRMKHSDETYEARMSANVAKNPNVTATMRRKNRYTRHLYNAYDLDLKKSVVIFAEENGNKEAGARYGISEANIRRWRRLKNDIFGKPLDYDRGKLRTRKRVNYNLKIEKVNCDGLEQESLSSVDSMPLQERLSKVAAQEKIASGATGQVLKSQPLSPTKLKVTRSPKVTKPVEPPPSPVNEEMCLRWNSHHSNMQTAFPSILSKEQYVDVTLAAEGKTLKCHRLILSSCSPYFEEILSGISPFQHPVLFMRDIPFWILKSLCDFMYAGEVHIFQNKLEELLTVAEALKIKGLAGKSTPPENQEETRKENNSNNHNNNNKEVKKKQPPEKEKTQYHHHHHHQPLKKNSGFAKSNNFGSTSHDFDDDLLDPLDLLEPLYEEAAEEKKPSTIVRPKENKYQYQPVKKPFGRRLRKRKYSEQREPSPPPVFSFRKGTRSRPNVKIPKYYHSDYNLAKPAANAPSDPLLDVDEIKTEPIDVEDNNLVDYSDEDHYLENSLEPANCNSPIIITSAKPPLPQAKFKKIKLTKPVITEVHTIEEPKTTTGGLEVIKITVQQPGDVNSRKDEVVNREPLRSLIITSGEPPDGEVPERMEIPVEPVIPEEEMREVPENSAPPEETEVAVEEMEVAVKEAEVVTEKETEIVVGEVTEEETEPVVEKEIVEEETENLEGAVTENDLESEKANEEGVPEEDSKEEETEADASVAEENTPEVTIAENVEEGVVVEQERGTEEVANNNSVEECEEGEEVPVQDIQIQDVRSTLEEMDAETEEERRTTSLDHLEKEAMNVANAINLENQAGPPDIE